MRSSVERQKGLTEGQFDITVRSFFLPTDAMLYSMDQISFDYSMLVALATLPVLVAF